MQTELLKSLIISVHGVLNFLSLYTNTGKILDTGIPAVFQNCSCYLILHLINISDKCQLEPETGPCIKNIPRWFYNTSVMQCEEFVYGGCHGNSNRFLTRDLCEKECSDVEPPVTIPSIPSTTQSSEGQSWWPGKWLKHYHDPTKSLHASILHIQHVVLYKKFPQEIKLYMTMGHLIRKY